MGDALEYNDSAKYSVENSRDQHYVNGLMSDTSDKRRGYFKKALKNLAEFVIENKNIRSVVVPAGIGKRGKVGHEWTSFHYAELCELARSLLLNNVKLILLEQEPHRNGDNAKACPATRQ